MSLIQILLTHNMNICLDIDAQNGTPILGSEVYNNYIMFQLGMKRAETFIVKPFLALNTPFLEKIRIRGHTILAHAVLNSIVICEKAKLTKFKHHWHVQEQGKFIEIAKLIINVAPRLCRVKDSDGRTPFELIPKHPITKELKKYWKTVNPLSGHKMTTCFKIVTRIGEKPIFSHNSEEYNSFILLQEAINSAKDITEVERLLALNNIHFLEKIRIHLRSLLHHVVLNCLFLDNKRKNKKHKYYRSIFVGSTDQFIEVAKCVIDVVPQLGCFKDPDGKTPFELIPNHPITKELKNYWQNRCLFI